MFDVGPRGNDRAQNHKSEGKQSEASNGPTEPEHLSVGDEDDRQILENGVYRDREKLKRFGARIDHSY
jgi:hypothetical protein